MSILGHLTIMNRVQNLSFKEFVKSNCKPINYFAEQLYRVSKTIWDCVYCSTAFNSDWIRKKIDFWSTTHL